MQYMQQILSVIAEAFEELKKLYTGFDPIQFHIEGKARPGESVFNSDVTDVESIVNKINDKLEEKVTWEVIPGKDGAVCFVATLDDAIGLESKSYPIAEEHYTIVRSHGSLIPSGKAAPQIAETNKVTFVLTPEWDKDLNSTKFALASVYPGEPDPTGDWGDFKEGDQVAGSDLLSRRINRVKNI